MIKNITVLRTKKIIAILSAVFIAGILFLTASCEKESPVSVEDDRVIVEEEKEDVTEEMEEPGKVTWKLSTREEQWVDMEELSLLDEYDGQRIHVTIDQSSKKQEIDGFGGAFNEKGWEALLLLSPEERDEVIKELFDPESGAKFNICRVPIGASDYATSRYTLNEVENDFDMENFSIDRDREYLIPYINAALGYRPDLKIWASVWTPPTWMKTNGEFDGGNMKDEPEIYEAYALYLARFVEEYGNEGIDIFAVAVQNEPYIETNYPSCLWTPEQFLVFIRDYMGPLFEERNLGAEIMLGTIQNGDYSLFPKTVLSDPVAHDYVSIVGFQWSGVNSVAETRVNYPDKRIMQTETECGNFYWKPEEFDPDCPQNDWKYGVHTWGKVKEYFDEGVNSYLLWNIVLDEEGKSIDSERPWPQNAAVVVDKQTKEVIYTPMFYAFKHFTFFVESGASYIDSAATGVEAVSFLNPDGEIIVVVQNSEEEAKEIRIGTSEYWFDVKIPEMSWSTFVIPVE